MHEEALGQDDIALLQLLAKGMTASQIAAHTDKAPRQVQQQVRALRAELGATTNIQAVVVALRRAVI